MEKEIIMTRRELLAAATALTVISCVPRGVLAALTQETMPYRTLGRTGEKVSLIGLGGYHLGKQEDEKESNRIIRTAIDSGINFMDNCWEDRKSVV